MALGTSRTWWYEEEEPEPIQIDSSHRSICLTACTSPFLKNEGKCLLKYTVCLCLSKFPFQKILPKLDWLCWNCCRTHRFACLLHGNGPIHWDHRDAAEKQCNDRRPPSKEVGGDPQIPLPKELLPGVLRGSWRPRVWKTGVVDWFGEREWNYQNVGTAVFGESAPPGVLKHLASVGSYRLAGISGILQTSWHW